MTYAIYHVTESTNGKGTFYYPSCCKYWIYSVKGEMAYHRKLCPKCYAEGRKTTLFLAGTKEAIKLVEKDIV